jgi:hypothetical protein
MWEGIMKISAKARLRIFAVVSATFASFLEYCAVAVLVIAPEYTGEGDGHLVGYMVLCGLISGVLGIGLLIWAGWLWRRATGDRLAKGTAFAFLWSIALIVLFTAGSAMNAIFHEH